MRASLRPAAVLLVLLSVVTGVAYPLLVAAVARVAFPGQAVGSPLPGGVGSEWIGQSFTSPAYFWSRLSATSPIPYEAAASSGSNLGPSNPLLTDAVRARIQALRAAGDTAATVPVDLVTASGSGLDPHISPAAAEWQVERVARVRGLDRARVRELVRHHTEGRTCGLLGEPRVHVLRLNLALDRLAATAAAR